MKAGPRFTYELRKAVFKNSVLLVIESVWQIREWLICIQADKWCATTNHILRTDALFSNTLFVFSSSDPKQNAMFLAQFFMLFHMVALVLLSMVAFLTIFLLAENLQQPIRVFEIGGYWSCHGEQNASYHVKEDKNLYQKMVSKVTLHFVWGHLSRKQTVWYYKEVFWYFALWLGKCW